MRDKDTGDKDRLPSGEKVGHSNERGAFFHGGGHKSKEKKHLEGKEYDRGFRPFPRDSEGVMESVTHGCRAFDEDGETE